MLSINYVDPYQTDLGAILQVLLDFGISKNIARIAEMATHL